MKTEEWVILIVFVLVAIGRCGGMNKDGSDRGDTWYEDISLGVPNSTPFFFINIWFTPHTSVPHTLDHAHLRKPWLLGMCQTLLRWLRSQFSDIYTLIVLVTCSNSSPEPFFPSISSSV